MMHLYKKACDVSTASMGNECGWISLDINGLKGPNKYGEDLYLFIITKNGILPHKSDDCTTYGKRCAYEYLYN